MHPPDRIERKLNLRYHRLQLPLLEPLTHGIVPVFGILMPGNLQVLERMTNPLDTRGEIDPLHISSPSADTELSTVVACVGVSAISPACRLVDVLSGHNSFTSDAGVE